MRLSVENVAPYPKLCHEAWDRVLTSGKQIGIMDVNGLIFCFCALSQTLRAHLCREEV
jgi:hypothetical protein